MPQALIGLGSNLGDRKAHLQIALDALAATEGICVLAVSAFHETQPIGGPPGQEPFLNAGARLETSLPPETLLARLQEIELGLGRTRGTRWSPRTLDLDLLLYDDLIWNTPQLTVPHPRMAFRRFVLQPAVEIAPDMRHPVIGWTVRQLRENLNAAAPDVAIGGGRAKDRAALAERIAQRLPLGSIPTWPGTGEQSPRPKLILWLGTPERNAA
jgi:2-amino-4-hydroxy-6-hydroxymethyldihydropteridine diphosphokinase